MFVCDTDYQYRGIRIRYYNTEPLIHDIGYGGIFVPPVHKSLLELIFRLLNHTVSNIDNTHLNISVANMSRISELFGTLIGVKEKQ